MTRRLIPDVRVSRFSSQKKMKVDDVMVDPVSGYPIDAPMEMYGSTTDATPTALSAYHNDDTEIMLDYNQSAAMRILVVARVTEAVVTTTTGATLELANGDSQAWEITALVKKNATDASIEVVAQTKTDIGSSPAMAAESADVLLVANTATGGLYLQVTGVDGQEIEWDAKFLSAIVEDPSS